MLVPGWVLIATATVGVLAIAILGLVVRRALTELFFWRGAYKRTNDRAYELLREIDQVRAARGSEPALERDLRRMKGGGLASLHQVEVTVAPDRSLVQRYNDCVQLVEQAAARFRIDWVTDEDGQFWVNQYQERPSPQPSSNGGDLHD